MLPVSLGCLWIPVIAFRMQYLFEIRNCLVVACKRESSGEVTPCGKILGRGHMALVIRGRVQCVWEGKEMGKQTLKGH